MSTRTNFAVRRASAIGFEVMLPRLLHRTSVYMTCRKLALVCPFSANTLLENTVWIYSNCSSSPWASTKAQSRRVVSKYMYLTLIITLEAADAPACWTRASTALGNNGCRFGRAMRPSDHFELNSDARTHAGTSILYTSV